MNNKKTGVIAMKKIFLLISLSFIGCEPAAAIDSSACYSIVDADARVSCLAISRREPSMCYAVQDKVLRQQCFIGTLR